MAVMQFVCRPGVRAAQQNRIDGNCMKIVFYEMAFKRAINRAIANSNVSNMVYEKEAMAANETDRCVKR